MAITIQKAKRQMARLKIGISGSSGSGKTLSALLLSYGLIAARYPGISEEEMWEKICVVDTENGSGSLYVGTKVGSTCVGEYLTINLDAPFSAARYLEAIDAAEGAGVECLIIDSLSHAWSGEGGLLDMQANIAKRSGNGYTAWRDVTPLHNKLVDRILQCPMHVITTLRTKTEYVIEENEKGKKAPRKVGLAPIFRDGLEYEFSIFFELAQDHSAAASKDRTGLFDGQYFIISPDTGKKVAAWLNDGNSLKENAPSIPQITKAHAVNNAEVAQDNTEDAPIAEKLDAVIRSLCAGATQEAKAGIAAKIKSIAGTANYKAVKDEATLQMIYEAFKEENK